jgi:hypothetical protein
MEKGRSEDSANFIGLPTLMFSFWVRIAILDINAEVVNIYRQLLK